MRPVVDTLGSGRGPRGRYRLRIAAAIAGLLLVTSQAAAASPPNPKADPGLQNALDSLGERARAYGLANHAPPSDPIGYFAENFEVLGHNALGERDSNGDVWAHGNFAYVGTWRSPCNGRGVKVIDVSDLSAPRVIGAVASRPGTSTEDMVVRSVSTPWFTGDLLAVGLQRCGGQRSLDRATFGPEFWDVTDPYRPKKLGYLGVSHGGGGVHELDLFQRGDHVYALLATPFSEWFDPVPGGDFRIVDVTDPSHPMQVGEWGAAAHLGLPGPFFGQGSFGASFDHSARASADGTKAYVSYWDQGVLTLDISDVTNPVLIGQTQYSADDDGDAHSVAEYGNFLLQNDEDFDPRSPAHVLFGADFGIANESPFTPALWEEPGHQIAGDVFLADGQGCEAADYPADAAGKIAVLHTEFSIFGSGANPLCGMFDQDAAADAAGVSAIVHAFVSPDTSPQFFDFSQASVPVLFTDPPTAAGMIAAGSATLEAQQPTWGFLRVFDKATGQQVAKFDDVFGIHDLAEAGNGFWSIHNNEVVGDRTYASWYSNGVLALDLTPLSGATPSDPIEVGQFIPGGFPEVWGVATRAQDDVLFVSDLGSGLWIIRPTGPAAP